MIAPAGKKHGDDRNRHKENRCDDDEPGGDEKDAAKSCHPVVNVGYSRLRDLKGVELLRNPAKILFSQDNQVEKVEEDEGDDRLEHASGENAAEQISDHSPCEVADIACADISEENCITK